jgi:hypothetical protein
MFVDYLLRYDDEDAAKADAEVLAAAMGLPSAEEWQRQHTIPDVKAWQPTQDTVEVIPPTETMPEHERTIHTYLAGYFIAVSLDREEPILLDAPALQFALDREACNIGKPFVIKNNIGQLISDVGWEPMFAGSTYPLGGYVLSPQPM